MRRRLIVTVLMLAGCSGGRDYPSRPILLICPWAKSGGSDRVANTVARLLEQDLNVNVNVKNATGGEGVTGHGEGARATPDGHTLTLMTVEINMLRWRGRTKLGYRDFAPGVLLNRDPAGIFVRKDAPWTSLKELEDDIRREPAKRTASGTALGGIWHLALAGWLTSSGLAASDVTWVASQGSTPAMGALIAKGVDIVCCSLPEAAPFLKGEVRCLGVMGDVRHPLFPEVATFREQGVDWTMGAWRGIGLPRGTPQRVLDVIVPALERVARSDAFLEYMKKEGFGAACEPPAEFEKSLERTDALMRELLTSPAFLSLSKSRFSATTFPAGLGVLFGLATAVALARGLLKPGGEAIGWRLWLEGLLLVAGCALLMNTLGFVLAAAPMVFVALLRLGTRPFPAATTALVAVATAYVVFGRFLDVPFPAGPLGW